MWISRPEPHESRPVIDVVQPAQGSIVEGSLRVKLRLIDASRNSVDLSFALGRTAAQLIRTRGGSYFRANRTFWTAHAGPRAAALADRWIELPPASSRSFTASLGQLAPDVLARCLAEDHGTLSAAGKITIKHRRAIAIRDAGDAPESSPGVLAVAAAGIPYPLAYTATAGQRAGGRIDVCNQGKANTAHGTITFDHFDHVPPITSHRSPHRSPRRDSPSVALAGPAASAGRSAPRGEVVRLPGGHYAAFLEEHEHTVEVLVAFLQRHLIDGRAIPEDPV